MAQHFLLSAAARSLSPAKVAPMSERGAENSIVAWIGSDWRWRFSTVGGRPCFDLDASMPFKANAARRHHIPKQKRKVTNWAAYDANLR